MARKDQARVTLVVDGRTIGVAKTRTGGGTDSEDVKSRAGGGEALESLGSQPTNDNVELTFLQRLNARETVRWLRSRVGKGRAVVTEQPLDGDLHASGTPDTWTGTVKAAALAEADANDTDPADFTVEISTDTPA
jgi:hypothetical protein